MASSAAAAQEGSSPEAGAPVTVDDKGHGRVVFRHELLRKFGTVWEARAVNASPCAGMRFSYFNNSRNAHNSNILQVILRDHGFHKTEPPDGEWNIFWCAGQVHWLPRPPHPTPLSVPQTCTTVTACVSLFPVGGPTVFAVAQALPEGEQVPEGELPHAQGESLVKLLANANPLRLCGLWSHAADMRPPRPARDVGGASPRQVLPWIAPLAIASSTAH